ncbi:Uncharacterised protein [uncultured archaeon]|nr:Uncharacterised protein [uncultured archaeon]
MILLELMDNIWIVLGLCLFIWIYGWAKESLGSAKLAILFAVIVFYLTFYSYPYLVWILAGFFIIQTAGKELMTQLNPFGGDQLH